MNVLDRAIQYVAPSYGLRRALAREQLAVRSRGGISEYQKEALGRYYDAARRDRDSADWFRSSGSADAVAQGERIAIRDAARSLVANDPHAKKGIGVLVANWVGTGILTSPYGNNERTNDRLAGRWREFCEREQLYVKQALVARSRCESGEVLARFVPTVPTSPRMPAFTVQIIEADHLDDARNQRIDERTVIRNGVEVRDGVPVAYWLFDEHPGDAFGMQNARASASRRIPASDVIHVFRQDRPGQTRGVSDFAPVVRRLRGLSDYDEAERVRKKIAACLVWIITSPTSYGGASVGTPTPQAWSQTPLEAFFPGMVKRLNPGESITPTDPKPSEDYESYMAVGLHAVAAGLEMPYELLTGDLKEVSYTSHRGGLVQFKVRCEMEQYNVLIPQFVGPVWQRFVREASVLDPAVTYVPAQYTPPKFGLLDPSKEIPAMVEAIQAGLEPWEDVVRSLGYEPDEVFDKLQEFYRELDARQLTITSDARTQLSGLLAPKPTQVQVPAGGDSSAGAAQ